MDALAELNQTAHRLEAEAAFRASWSQTAGTFYLRPSLTFWGGCLARIDVRPDWTIPTASTNGRQLRINPDFWLAQTPSRRLAIVAHEIAHCVLLHHTRRGARDPRRWNVAGDLAINDSLRKSGFDTGPDWLYPETFNQPPDLAADEYYAALDPDQADSPEAQQGTQQAGQVDDAPSPQPPARTEPGSQPDPQPQPQPQPSQGQGQPQPQPGQDGQDQDGQDDGQGQDGQDGQGQGQGQGQGFEEGPAPSQLAEEARWQQIAAEAAEAARSRGRDPFGGLRAVPEIREPAADLDELLRDYVAPSRDDYSWTRPSRRGAALGVILPSRRDETLAPVAVTLDTSGSVGREQLAAFVARLDGIAQLDPVALRLVYHHAAVYRVQTWTPDDGPLELADIETGGTDHAEAFRLACEPFDDGQEPAALIVLTDCYTCWPEAPSCPVLIVRQGDGPPPPWPHQLIDIPAR